MSATRYLLDHVNHDALVGPESGIGPWQEFAPDADPGWTVNMRYRLVPMGLQLSGVVSGDVPANARARVGVFPAGYRPMRTQVVVGAVLAGSGLTYGYGVLEVYPDGQANTMWTVGGVGAQFVLSAIMALD